MKELKQMNSLMLVRAFRKTSNKPRTTRREDFCLRAIGSELVDRARSAVRSEGMDDRIVRTHRVEI